MLLQTRKGSNFDVIVFQPLSPSAITNGIGKSSIVQCPLSLPLSYSVFALCSRQNLPILADRDRANSNQGVIISQYTFTVLNFCSIGKKHKSAIRHHGYRSERKTSKKNFSLLFIYISRVFLLRTGEMNLQPLKDKTQRMQFEMSSSKKVDM